MTQLNGSEPRALAIIEILKAAEGLVPISAIHDRLPDHLRGSSQLTLQECQRLVRSGRLQGDTVAGGRAAYRFLAEAAPAVAPASSALAPPQEPPAAKREAAPRAPTSKAGAVRDQVLGLLRSRDGWKTPELAKACGLNEDAMRYHLCNFKNAGLVRKSGGAVTSQWHLAEAQPGAIAAVDKLRGAAPRAPASTVRKALEQLEQNLRRPAVRVIQRADVKLQVLDRLAALVDPTIAAVLAEIRADLAPTV